MRIVAFSTYFLPYISGAITYPNSVFRQWVGEGHQVEVLTFRHDPRLQTCEVLDGVNITRLDYWFRLSKGFIAFGRTPSVLIKVLKADLVFLNLPNFEGLGLAILAFLFRKPVVALFNCEVDLGKSPIERLISFVLNLSVRLQVMVASQVVTYTEDYAESTLLLKGYVARSNAKLKFIPPLIQTYTPVTELAERLRRLKSDRLWVGFCGRVSREKGLEFLIEALVRLRAQGVHDGIDFSRLTLVMAGPYGPDVSGEQEYYEKIRNLLQQHQLDHHFLGLIPTTELAAVYQSFDLMVLPSLNKTEAFGIVQAEALCYGTWLVTSNLPGVRSCVRLTSFGALATPGDSNDLSAKIHSMIATRPDRDSTSVEARKFFDRQKFVSAWQSVLKIVST